MSFRPRTSARSTAPAAAASPAPAAGRQSGGPRIASRDLAQIAVFAALIAALGLPGTLYIGSSGVPITFQTLGVMLAGAILGPWKGLAAVAVFDALVFAGLPLLAGGRGGPAFFTVAPTAGYAWGFLLGALVVGLATRAVLPRYPLWLGILGTALGGMLAIYAVGVPWTAAVLDLPLWTAAAGVVLYFPGDVIKVVATALIARQVHRAYPDLMRRRRTGAAG